MSARLCVLSSVKLRFHIVLLFTFVLNPTAPLRDRLLITEQPSKTLEMLSSQHGARQWDELCLDASSPLSKEHGLGFAPLLTRSVSGLFSPLPNSGDLILWQNYPSKI
jgi:hypothetical protein